MEKVVLDTSVIVKWFVTEEKSTQALQFLSDYQNEKIQIYEPEIVLLELTNALYFGARFASAVVERAVRDFYLLEILQVSLTENLMIKALRLTGKFPIAMYDSVFVALAEQEQCFLVTCDTKHHRKEMWSKIKYL